MPPLIRLPGHVNDDEVRVYWDRTDEGDDLHVHGPRSVRRFAMSIFTAKREAAAGDMTERFRARQAGYVEDKPSYLEELEALGYDPRTLVFSIRKKGSPPPDAEVPDDIRKRLEDAQQALQALRQAVHEREECKGVYLYSDDEYTALCDAVSDAETAIARAIDIAPA